VPRAGVPPGRTGASIEGADIQKSTEKAAFPSELAIPDGRPAGAAGDDAERAGRAAEKRVVLDAIARAFADVPRDEACTLHQALMTGEVLISETALRTLTEEELEATRELDCHRHWRDVPAEDLDRCDDALAFLTLDAWRFYLPAYMVRALDVLELPAWRTSLLGTIVFELELPVDDFGQRCFALERYIQLDERQIAAVAAFLRYVARHATPALNDGEDAAHALARYWGLAPERRPQLPEEPIPSGRVPLH
jgi:hypothetical protein